VQRGARLDEKPERVEQRNDDGPHDCRLPENAWNLNRRNTYEVLGSHSVSECDAGSLSDTSTAASTRQAGRVRGVIRWVARGDRIGSARPLIDAPEPYRNVPCSPWAPW
jgi:hypothetical protein